MTAQQQPQTDNLAIASLILGILSVTLMGPLTGIPAIITGVLSLKNPANKDMAVAGIIMGGISVFFAILAVLFFIVLLFLGVFAASSYEGEPSFPDSTTPDSSSFQQRA